MVIFAVLTGGGIAVAFWFGIKDISTPKLIEVLSGVALAILVLSALGFFFLKIIKYLNADEERNAIATRERNRQEGSDRSDNSSSSEDTRPNV